jgi:hypothetical protein
MTHQRGTSLPLQRTDRKNCIDWGGIFPPLRNNILLYSELLLPFFGSRGISKIQTERTTKQHKLLVRSGQRMLWEQKKDSLGTEISTKAEV